MRSSLTTGVGPVSNLSELRRQAALFLLAARRAEDGDAVRIFRNLAASVLAWAEDVERIAAARADEAEAEAAGAPAPVEPEDDPPVADTFDGVDEADRWAPRLRRSA